MTIASPVGGMTAAPFYDMPHSMRGAAGLGAHQSLPMAAEGSNSKLNGFERLSEEWPYSVIVPPPWGYEPTTVSH
jgi:hypothetical protein